jgi:hypothetical protein
MPFIFGQDALKSGLKVAIYGIASAMKDFGDPCHDRFLVVVVELVVARGSGKGGVGWRDSKIRGSSIEDDVQEHGGNRKDEDQEDEPRFSNVSSHQ